MKTLQLLPLFCSLLTLTGPSLLTAAEQTAAKPNIIIIFTDDQGYADVGAQGIVDDIRTPNIDRLMDAGVRFTSGYITSPQCAPSRAGLLTGRYQQRFGIDAISDNPMSLEEVTVAERLKKAGYRTGMVGKWHLDFGIGDRKALRKEPNAVVQDPEAPLGRRLSLEAFKKYSPAAQGFDEFYQNVAWWQSDKRWANYKADGTDLDPEGEWLGETTGDRLDDETQGALGFIKRNHGEPFFLYLAYSGPHTPLEATEERIARFPGEMKERRRVGLAMMATIDDGVGEIISLLNDYGILEDTLIFYASDNGAPLKLTMEDSLMTKDQDNDGKRQRNLGGWDGSLNEPFLGEKGLLLEGGIRVPFSMTWKGMLPAGKVVDEPVIATDMTATAMAVAGLPSDPAVDGVNLIPYVTGETDGPPHEALYWRFWNQAAIRSGEWKLLYLGEDRIHLFDLSSEEGERQDLAGEYPEKTEALLEQLEDWAGELRPPGLRPNVPKHALRMNDFYLTPSGSDNESSQ